MSLQSRLTDALARVGQEIKAARSERYTKNQVDTFLNKLLPPAGTVEVLAFDIGSSNTWTDSRGWIWFCPNGSTIGSTLSGASVASADAQALFLAMWPHYSVLTNTGGATGKGANAAADWAANRRLSLPDLRGRVLVGKGQGSGLATNYAIGQRGGAESTTLATGNLPSHDHTFTGTAHGHGATDPGHNHNLVTLENIETAGSYGLTPSGGYADRRFFGQGAGPPQPVSPSTTGLSINSATAGGTIGNTGSGTAFDNRQPWAAASIVWLMKPTLT